MATWFAVKAEDHRQELEEQNGNYVFLRNNIHLCWCPVCREPMRREDVVSIKELIHVETRQYLARLATQDAEEEGRRELYRLRVQEEVETQPHSGVSIVADKCSLLDAVVSFQLYYHTTQTCKLRTVHTKSSPPHQDRRED